MIRRASGGRVILSGLLLAVGAGLLFTVGPYRRLKEAMAHVAFPEEGVSSPRELWSFLETLGPGGRELYLRVQVLDLANPVLIGLFGLALVAWMLRLSTDSPARAWGLLIPLVAPVADLVEDGLIASSILAFPGQASASSALPLVSTLKFAGFALTLFLSMALVPPALRRRRGSGGRRRR
jgi:hypothetical protein